jgi:hypothetical protein
MTEPHALCRGTTRWDCVEDDHNYQGRTCARCHDPITGKAKYCRECGQWARRYLRPSIKAAIGRVRRAREELTR